MISIAIFPCSHTNKASIVGEESDMWAVANNAPAHAQEEKIYQLSQVYPRGSNDVLPEQSLALRFAYISP